MRKTLILFLIIGFIFTVSPDVSAGKTLLGFTDNPKPIARAAKAIKGTSKVVRIPVYWEGVVANGWAWIDNAVKAARKYDQKILLTVYGTNAPNMEQLANFYSDLNHRYPYLWAVQAWNEPNLAHIGGNLSVDQTIDVVKTAERELPGVRVVGPGVSPTVPSAKRYQKALYNALPKSIGVGINIFTYRSKAPIEAILDAYRQAKRDGDGAKVYVTEIGFHQAYFPNQAEVSADAYKALRRAGAATVIFYRLLPDKTSSVQWEKTGKFNVLRRNLRPTRTFKALKKVS